MRLPKSNRVVGAVKAVLVWFRPAYVPGWSLPSDWFVVKMSGYRTGYIESKFIGTNPHPD
jgi:hypothetical protein